MEEHQENIETIADVLILDKIVNCSELNKISIPLEPEEQEKKKQEYLSINTKIMSIINTNIKNASKVITDFDYIKQHINTDGLIYNIKTLLGKHLIVDKYDNGSNPAFCFFQGYIRYISLMRSHCYLTKKEVYDNNKADIVQFFSQAHSLGCKLATFYIYKYLNDNNDNNGRDNIIVRHLDYNTITNIEYYNKYKDYVIEELYPLSNKEYIYVADEDKYEDNPEVINYCNNKINEITYEIPAIYYYENYLFNRDQSFHYHSQGYIYCWIGKNLTGIYKNLFDASIKAYAKKNNLITKETHNINIYKYKPTTKHTNNQGKTHNKKNKSNSKKKNQDAKNKDGENNEETNISEAELLKFDSYVSYTMQTLEPFKKKILTAYENAISFGFYSAYMNLFDFYHYIGEYKNAIDTAFIVIDTIDYLKGKMYYRLGYLYSALENYVNAKKMYLLAIENGYYSCYYELLFTYIKLKDENNIYMCFRKGFAYKIIKIINLYTKLKKNNNA